MHVAVAVHCINLFWRQHTKLYFFQLLDVYNIIYNLSYYIYNIGYSNGIFLMHALLKQGRIQHKEGCKQQPLLGSKSGTGVK